MQSTDTRLKLERGDALLIVDVQNDFLPGGALGIADADEIIPAINRCIEMFVEAGLPIFATRDWHPVNHSSFREQGGPWPIHCVAGTEGAAISGQLNLPADTEIVDKGAKVDLPGYSGFEATRLEQLLQKYDVHHLFVGGLATDYCVRATAGDACRKNYRVFLIRDGTRAVDANPGDGERAIAELKKLGAEVISSEALAT